MAQPFTVVSQGRLMIRIVLDQNGLRVGNHIISAVLLTVILLPIQGAVALNSRLIWSRVPVSAEFDCGKQLNIVVVVVVVVVVVAAVVVVVVIVVVTK